MYDRQSKDIEAGDRLKSDHISITKVSLTFVLPRPNTMRVLIAFGILLFCTSFFSVEEAVISWPQKVRGVAIVGPPKAVNPEFLSSIKSIHADHVCIMPYAYGLNDNGEIYYKGLDWQWWGERKEGISAMVKEAHSNNVKVMLKPHIWFRHGSFTGHFDASTKKDWEVFEHSYEVYIIEYAWLAREMDVEIYCIGTELSTFVKKRPEFWHALIRKVRSIYSGKITYAGNWDTYADMPFWSELDIIGIDAYFPLSETRTPNVNELKKGWTPYYRKIVALQRRVNKPVVFLEYGYRSVDHTARKPWDSSRGGHTVNLQGQANAYRVLYELFWEEPWFIGGFLWKWHTDHERAGGAGNTRFTPQNKPVEQLIRARYAS